MDTLDTLPKRVAARMTELGIKQKKLALMVKVEQPSISALLKGEIKKPRFISDLARALQTTVQWLEEGGESPPAASQPAIAADSPFSQMMAEELVEHVLHQRGFDVTPRELADFARNVRAIAESDWQAKALKRREHYRDIAMRLVDGAREVEQEVLPPIKKLEKGKKE